MDAQVRMAKELATLPAHLGGIANGLRRALRTAPAAFWASWADVLDSGTCLRHPKLLGRSARLCTSPESGKLRPATWLARLTRRLATSGSPQSLENTTSERVPYLPTLCPDVRSHSGLDTGPACSGAPTAPELESKPFKFRTLLLERIRLPVPLTLAMCEGCAQEKRRATVAKQQQM